MLGTTDSPTPDCAEKVHVSSLTLLKMPRGSSHGCHGTHARTISQRIHHKLRRCIHHAPKRDKCEHRVCQSGLSNKNARYVAADRTWGDGGGVVSFPPGCWLSSTDINMQSSFETLNARAVALVVDPIQWVKGKVVIDCFWLINPQLMMMGQEP
eukprot:CCRYP_011896-RA/>CCRYP_011896-RA protein AED:0.25 eAED:0.23 QI:0/0/0/1/0/0/2/0/153